MQHTLKLAAPSAAIALAGLVAFSIPASGRANPRDDVPAGGLDQRFGYVGIASTPLSSVTADGFLAVTVGEDGQTYAAGFVTLGTDQAIATDQAMAVARIAPDGSLDQSFDGDGIGIVNVAVDGRSLAAWWFSRRARSWWEVKWNMTRPRGDAAMDNGHRPLTLRSRRHSRPDLR